MILSLNLLTKNLLEIEEEIVKIVEENPFLEFEPLNIPFEYRRVKKKDLDDDYDEENFTVQTRSLKIHLIDQFYAMNCDEESERIFLFLIDSIDDHGFLKIDRTEIAKELKSSEEKISEMIEFLKSLDPAGVGSRDVKEALKAQTDDPVVIKLIDMLEVIKTDSRVAKKLGLSQKEFEEAFSKLKTLNPYPSNGFYESQYTQYVEPDIFVIEKDNGYEVILNERFELRFSSLDFYEKLIESDDKSYKEFAKVRYEQAKNLIEAFSKRRETLYKLGNMIIEREKDFLKGGKIVPLKVADVAIDLNLSPSTVTRAISTKYLKTPVGIFSFKNFFERFIYRSDDGNFSREDIKNQIAGIISKENKREPLSDSKIEEILKSNGLQVSRRVIVKYREELSIPSSSKRRLR